MEAKSRRQLCLPKRVYVFEFRKVLFVVLALDGLFPGCNVVRNPRVVNLTSIFRTTTEDIIV